jgi:C4-dicarboxylate-specific signal transduction histidine kinase
MTTTKLRKSDVAPILNLLLNAAHAIAPGNLERNQVRLSTGSDAQGRAVLEVVDSGPSIPTELQQRIFEPFSQVDPTLSRRRQGAGLGLAIRQIVASKLPRLLALKMRMLNNHASAEDITQETFVHL